MKSYNNLYQQICSPENLQLAYKKARKGKTLKQYVIGFEENIKDNLSLLRTELLLHSYRPSPLKNFILRDPKTRKISISDFRDRIVHHAICNLIEPLFDKSFIYDSYANRKGKGNLAAIKRLEQFQRKVSHNKTNTVKFGGKTFRGFFFKGDIKKYFDSINHEILLKIVRRRIKDQELIFLLKIILQNHSVKEEGRGMPLGNLTSQFLANVYLNELDQFVKHKLKAKYYLRYVDDFVILHCDENELFSYKREIGDFLDNNLNVVLNSDKSYIKPLSRGVEFLGFRVFYHHKLLRKRNKKNFYRKLAKLEFEFQKEKVDYDNIYDFMEGWFAYAKSADTYNLRQRIIYPFEKKYPLQIATKEINRGINQTRIPNPHLHPASRQFHAKRK